MFPYGETVTVQTAAWDVDPYSEDLKQSWEWTPTEVDVTNVAVADGGSLEPADDTRNAVDSDFDLIFPPDAEVTAQNRVIVRGLVCEVVGRPFRWMNPFTGWTPGLVVKARIREG